MCKSISNSQHFKSIVHLYVVILPSFSDQCYLFKINMDIPSARNAVPDSSWLRQMTTLLYYLDRCLTGNVCISTFFPYNEHSFTSNFAPCLHTHKPLPSLICPPFPAAHLLTTPTINHGQDQRTKQGCNKNAHCSICTTQECRIQSAHFYV